MHAGLMTEARSRVLNGRRICTKTPEFYISSLIFHILNLFPVGRLLPTTSSNLNHLPTFIFQISFFYHKISLSSASSNL